MFRAEPGAGSGRGAGAIVLAERTARRDRALAAALLTACAGVVSLWPYTSVVAAGSWSSISVTVIVLVALSGFVVRRLRIGRFMRGLLTVLAQCVIAIAALTALLLPQSAVLGVIPTGSTLSAVGRLAAQAIEQVQFGTAPLANTLALGVMLGIGFALVAIILDHLIATRFALTAAIVVVVVGAIPMIVTLGEANLPWFVVFAVLTLFLLRYSVRGDGRSPKHTSTAVALGTGAAAIAAALVITPLLPISTTWVGAGTSAQLDPSLRLGEDLRRPTPFTVMTLATNAPTAPYLRIATLSEFNGSTWAADDADLQPTSDGFGTADWADDIEAVERRTSIRITGISGSWLPVPYAATKIVGASSGWQTMPSNRTVTAENQDAANEDYTVTAAVAQPTREQIQAASATPQAGMEVPELVAVTARSVTADAANDYDRLIAMQTWFRSQFEYSLDAPVDGDFDGTGTDAVEEFLRVRSGYCIHFSGAFALMAQALEMQVRVVVGYLPGSLTDEKRGDESIYTVDSDQLHAWPEVHFEGVGWVPFEPTASLGTPTDFLPAATTGGSSGDGAAPEASAEPTAAPTQDPRVDEDQGGAAATGDDALQRLDPTPVVLVSVGILIVLLLPALVRRGVRMRRKHRAQRGDAGAVWQEVRATLLDLRLPVSDADTPRMRGAELIERGVDPAAVGVLVDAVERASYAPTGADAADLSKPLGRVIVELARSVDVRDRVTSVLLPTSLFTSRASRATASV
ncbi:transglutaminase family protein [Microbacterium sp.]|uniref:transglutaminase family protein n=1 Tax=Microbacterium sp. TaxID=51671 RepID=UPI003F9CA121